MECTKHIDWHTLPFIESGRIRAVQRERVRKSPTNVISYNNKNWTINAIHWFSTQRETNSFISMPASHPYSEYSCCRVAVFQFIVKRTREETDEQDSIDTTCQRMCLTIEHKVRFRGPTFLCVSASSALQWWMNEKKLEYSLYFCVYYHVIIECEGNIFT